MSSIGGAISTILGGGDSVSSSTPTTTATSPQAGNTGSTSSSVGSGTSTTAGSGAGGNSGVGGVATTSTVIDSMTTSRSTAVAVIPSSAGASASSAALQSTTTLVQTITSGTGTGASVMVVTQTATTQITNASAASSTAAAAAAISASLAAGNGTSDGGLTSTSRTVAIAVPSAVGGLLVLIGVVMLGRWFVKRRAEAKAADDIKWPEVATSPSEQKSLYPEPTHPGGGHGFGVGDDDELDSAGRDTAHSPTMASAYRNSFSHGSPMSGRGGLVGLEAMGAAATAVSYAASPAGSQEYNGSQGGYAGDDHAGYYLQNSKPGEQGYNPGAAIMGNFHQQQPSPQQERQLDSHSSNGYVSKHPSAPAAGSAHSSPADEEYYGLHGSGAEESGDGAPRDIPYVQYEHGGYEGQGDDSLRRAASDAGQPHKQWKKWELTVHNPDSI